MMAIERQSVYGDHGEQAAERCREKVVRRRNGIRLVHTTQGKAREQADRVKVARVIADHDERPVEREVLLPDDLEAIVGPQDPSHRQLHRAAKDRHADPVQPG
jgi:hypothetical protein